MGRKKINEILKTELGLTSTGYVNTLRLTEAARLLKDRHSTPIAEIAYSVGYTSISHVNKLLGKSTAARPGCSGASQPAPLRPPDPPSDTA